MDRAVGGAHDVLRVQSDARTARRGALETLARRALLAVAVITVVSGAAQLVAPRLVLGAIGGEVRPATTHFFAIIGMFMVLFGGLLFGALRAPAPVPIALLWASLQKIGACAAVSLGVARGLFSPLALLVATFDGVSGLLGLWYWARVRRLEGS